MRCVAQNKAHVALRQVCFYVAQALVQERIVPQVGVRKVRHARKVHHHRQLQLIGDGNRTIQRGVVQYRTLRALHPVHDGFSVGSGCTIAANRYAIVAGQHA